MRKALALAVLVAAVTVGCGESKPRKMTVGVVDTERVVAEMPEFREMNLTWAADTGSFLSSIPRSRDELDKKKYQELNDRIAASSKVWQARSSKFYQDAWSRISSAGAVVAKERGLDMIVIDTQHLPAVQYSSGENVTTDILIQLGREKKK